MALGRQSGSMNMPAVSPDGRMRAAIDMLGDKWRAEHSPGPRVLEDKDGGACRGRPRNEAQAGSVWGKQQSYRAAVWSGLYLVGGGAKTKGGPG